MLIAYKEHKEMIKSQLIDKIQESNPAFFEQLVVDLLLKMGYGYDENSGVVIGSPHDGVINEDKLGLDKIYIQAKRYMNDNTVGRPDLQVFVGAMENIQKGVFITTSRFKSTAIAYVEKQQQKNIKLIDGDMLTELMVKYGVGVVSIGKFYNYRLYIDYFDEG